jgi:L-arabonate dehydrase
MAVVFESFEEMRAKVDSEDLQVDENSVLVLKGCGPRGYPGFPEVPGPFPDLSDVNMGCDLSSGLVQVGNMPLPKKVLRKGVKDMVRISDARMSGTAYGTVVLHTSPEAAVGGPLAVVKTGDQITLDTKGRSVTLDISEDELALRLRGWKPEPPVTTRGYVNLYVNHVQQADKGADFDFLQGFTGAPVARHSH